MKLLQALLPLFLLYNCIALSSEQVSQGGDIDEARQEEVSEDESCGEEQTTHESIGEKELRRGIIIRKIATALAGLTVIVIVMGAIEVGIAICLNLLFSKILMVSVDRAAAVAQGEGQESVIGVLGRTLQNVPPR